MSTLQTSVSHVPVSSSPSTLKGDSGAGVTDSLHPASPILARRHFLLGASITVASTLAIPHAEASLPSVSTAPALPPSTTSNAGYQETDHVRHYYRTAQI